MAQSRSESPEFPVPLDEAAVDVVRVAAWYGSETSDDVFVSYTTLLLGLLYAPPGNGAGWQAEAHRVLRVDAIMASKPGLENTDQRRVPGVLGGIDPREGAWPTGRPLLSVSARNVLQQAYSVAVNDGGTDAAVNPADIMTSFLSNVPPAHREQAAAWGFAEAMPRLAPFLPRAAQSPPSAPTDLPGYDSAATKMLRLAFVLAARRKEAKRALLRSSGLLVALAEGARLLPEQDAVEVAMLRGMLEADPGYAAKRDAAFDMPADLAAAVEGVGSTFPSLSNNVEPILDDARIIAESVSGGPLVGVRHLLAALISLPDGTDRRTDARERMRDAGVDTDALREGLARIVSHRHPADRHGAWRDLLIGRNVAVVAVARPDTIPDDPRAEDTLGLRRYADALGALISASDQQPPLSIAVFGPWGSGKSFFMAMIHAAVAEFADAGKAAFKTKEKSPFHQRIIQIKFNAWHYAEGNLWASLVHAILVALQDELTPKTGPSAFQHVLDQLNLHEAAKVEAETRLRDAQQRLSETNAALLEADTQARERKAHEAALPTASDVLRAVQEEALALIGPAAGKADPQAWIASVGESVGKAATYLGRPELAAQVPALTDAAKDVAATTAALQVKVGAVRELLDEAQASAGRGLGLLGWMANARVSTDRLVLSVLVGGIVLVTLIAIAWQLEQHGAGVAATMTAVAAFFAPLLAALTAAIAWAKRHMADATRAFAVLGSIRDRVEARQSQAMSERDATLLAARRATTEAEAEAARRWAEFKAASAAVDKAREDVLAATSPERLKRFVAQRLAEGDYQRHLGLIHTIRSDLDRLETILKEVHPKEAALGAEAPVQRIVLFIDDLDRCPPARVVEVLEAVHLLLAFKLFVVVVGVDVRWVSQALRKRYPLQLGDTPGVASPLDYLEKVFQIPFWLPAMDAAAGRRLLESAVGPAARAVPVPHAAATTIGGAASPAGADPATAGADSVSGATDAAPERAAAEAMSSRTMQVDTVAVAEALELGDVERTRLLDMAAATGASPRRAKRFANLYRLLKASLSSAERRGFVLDGGKAGSYEGALMLLAAATGAPRGAVTLIEQLGAIPGEDAAAYLQACFARAAETLPVGEAAAFGAAKNLVAGVKDQETIAQHLRFWAPRVMRFAFDGQASQRMAPVTSIAVDTVSAKPRPARRKNTLPGGESAA